MRWWREAGKNWRQRGGGPKARPACLYPSQTLLGWDGALLTAGLTAEEDRCSHVARALEPQKFGSDVCYIWCLMLPALLN
jgi:hypothetical protein